jgi:hypothetical protein
MIFLKSVLVGVVAVVLASILYIVIPVVAELLMSFREESGIGAVAVGVGPLEFGVGLLIFILAFWWEYRRASRSRGGSPRD